jgi:hypothetical protein
MALGVGLEEPAADAAPRSRAWIFLIAALITAGGVVGALYLGAWAFDVRRFSTHERRLARLLAHSPTLSQVDQAFADEGTRLLGGAEDERSRDDLLRRFAGGKAAAVQAMGRGCTKLRAYATADMIYFVCFDAQEVMRSFALVSR